MSPWRRRYGASWLHLAVLVASFALTGYAVSRVLPDTSTLVAITAWFVGAALVWDLVLGPALALADRGARRLTPRNAGVSPLNHVRAPAVLSLLLLALFAPQVLQRSSQRYAAKTGLSQDLYLERWLAVTTVLFAVSAMVYGLRVLRARRRS